MAVTSESTNYQYNVKEASINHRHRPGPNNKSKVWEKFVFYVRLRMQNSGIWKWRKVVDHGGL